MRLIALSQREVLGRKLRIFNVKWIPRIYEYVSSFDHHSVEDQYKDTT